MFFFFMGKYSQVIIPSTRDSHCELWGVAPPHTHFKKKSVPVCECVKYVYFFFYSPNWLYKIERFVSCFFFP